MKFKITPLFIVYTIAFAIAVYYWFALNLPRNATTSNNYEGLIVYFLGCLCLITLVLDLILRFTIKSLQTIWVVEIILAVIAFSIIYFGWIAI